MTNQGYNLLTLVRKDDISRILVAYPTILTKNEIKILDKLTLYSGEETRTYENVSEELGIPIDILRKMEILLVETLSSVIHKSGR